MNKNKNEKCYCKYDKDGKRIGRCFRCMKMILNANLKGRNLATKQILNLECLKEVSESMFHSEKYNRDIRKANQLRKEIKEVIINLK